MIDYNGSIMFAFCFIVGLVSIHVGIRAKLGLYKRWWLMKSSPIVPTITTIIMIPFGFYIILFGSLALISLSPTTRGDIAIYILSPMLLILILLVFIRPKWLLPNWLVWIETYYPHLIVLLKREARAMGEKVWEQQVQTQEGLESWVQEVKQKHNIS